MGFAILRVQKLKSAVAVLRSMRHSFRAQETPNADPDKLHENTHIGAHNVAEGMAAFRARLPAKHRRDAVQCIEYLMTASPEAMQGKSRQEQDAYFSDALEWLRERHGEENVVYAGIHRDERTPHMYAYVVPVDAATGRLNARKWLGGARALSSMQTEFARDVGARHELERGIEGSKARHTRIRSFYAAMERQPQHFALRADDVQPRPLEPQSLTERLGLSRRDEPPEAVAARLTRTVQEQYTPAMQAAAVAHHTRKKAKEAQEAATRLQARMQPFLSAMEPLKELNRKRVAQQFEALCERELAHQQESERMATLEAERRKLEAERLKRIEALPGLERRSAGAALTFAQHANAALARAGGNADRVNWQAVEANAATEAIADHGQSPQDVQRAILRHSPARVAPGSHAQLEQWMRNNGPAMQRHYEVKHGHDVDRGPGLGR